MLPSTLLSRAISLIVFAALTLASFAFFNSGARGVAACEREGFGGPGTLSWWRPGSVCEGGEPQFVSVQLNATFVVIPAVLLVLAGAVWITTTVRDPTPV